jgi:hypothetical protein
VIEPESSTNIYVYILQPNRQCNEVNVKYNVTDLINELPGNSSVNTVQHATIEEAVLSLDPTDAPIDWLDSDHVICVYCRSMSVPWLYIYIYI